MNIINSIHDMQSFSLSQKGAGKRVAFVPTMGFLHKGHSSLLREGRKQGDILVLSIFVNPIQFGQNEDLDRYPRDMEHDCRIAAESGVDVVFAPTAAEMYPPGFQTNVSVRTASLPLCGAVRPGHFDGVATVVTKLFNIVQPDVAFFGKKDFQQLAVIRRLVRDMSLSVEIVGMPIVREADGLALSSRNAYLTADQRQGALCLYRAICRVRALFAAGETNSETLFVAARDTILQEQRVQLEYIELRDGITLDETPVAGASTLMALAIKTGTTRLIDNTLLGEEL